MNCLTRKEIKEQLVAASGGKCLMCRRVTDPQLIEFHHIFMEEKESTISRLLSRRSYSKVFKELDKCIPVCRRCHNELHDIKQKRFNKWQEQLREWSADAGYI